MTRSQQDSIRIVIAADQLFERVGLRLAIQEDPSLTVIAEARHSVDALNACGRLQPDVVLVDLGLPPLEMLAAMRAFREASPRTFVLMLGSFEDPALRRIAAQMDADSYLPRSVGSSELRRAIRRMLDGKRRQVGSGVTPGLLGGPELVDRLSARELEVLRLLARGHTNAYIARQLNIAPNTVKRHIEHILAKLQVKNRTQAAVRAEELGYLTSTFPTHTQKAG